MGDLNRPARRQSDRPHGEGAVLLVDDERSIREPTRRLLWRHGYEVLVAASAEEALRAFESRSQTINLLLTDVALPGMSGCELAERLRQHKPDLPILFMSGDPASIFDRSDALPPGMSFWRSRFRRSGCSPPCTRRSRYCIALAAPCPSRPCASSCSTEAPRGGPEGCPRSRKQ